MNFSPALAPSNLTSATYYIPICESSLLCAGGGSQRPLSQTHFAALGNCRCAVVSLRPVASGAINRYSIRPIDSRVYQTAQWPLTLIQ